MHLQRIDQKIGMIEAKREELQKNNKYQTNNIRILQNTSSTLPNYKQGLEIYSNTSVTPNVNQHHHAQLNLSVNLERLRVRNNGTTHEQSASSIHPLTTNTKGSFHLPPAVVSIKSTSPRTNRGRGAASQVSIHADALKDQMPVLREIYENPFENTGRDLSKKRRKSKKNRTARVNNETAI